MPSPGREKVSSDSETDEGEGSILLMLEDAVTKRKRMRCSRRSGVILYSYDNGHFMAYTSPPPAAEPLLKEKPFGGRSLQLLSIAAQDFRTQLCAPVAR